MLDILWTTNILFGMGYWYKCIENIYNMKPLNISKISMSFPLSLIVSYPFNVFECKVRTFPPSLTCGRVRLTCQSSFWVPICQALLAYCPPHILYFQLDSPHRFAVRPADSTDLHFQCLHFFTLKGTLHSKLAQDFLAGLKVYIFKKISPWKRSRLLPSLLRYLKPKYGKCCGRLITFTAIVMEFNELYLESLLFHAKDSTDFSGEERWRLS